MDKEQPPRQRDNCSGEPQHDDLRNEAVGPTHRAFRRQEAWVHAMALPKSLTAATAAIWRPQAGARHGITTRQLQLENVVCFQTRTTMDNGHMKTWCA